MQKSKEPGPIPLHAMYFYNKTQTLMNKLHAIKPGAYYIENDEHSCLYIKIHRSLGYFFDPCQGSMQIVGEQSFPLYCFIRESMGNDSPDAIRKEKQIEKLLSLIHTAHAAFIEETKTQNFSIPPFLQRGKKEELILLTFSIFDEFLFLLEFFSTTQIDPNFLFRYKNYFEKFKSMPFKLLKNEDLLYAINEISLFLKHNSHYFIHITPVELRDPYKAEEPTSLSPPLDPT